MTDVKDVQRALLEEAAEYYSKIWRTRDKSEREKFGNLRKAKQFEAALLEPVINEDNILSTLFWVDSEYRWELFELICDKSINTYILERTWHKNQECFQDDEGNVHLTFESNQLQETLYWVLHFGSAVKIVNPPELIKLYREEVKKMSQKS